MLSVRVVPVLVAFAMVVGSTTASSQGLGALRKKAEEAKKKVETAVDKKPTVDTAKAKPAPATAPASGGAAPASNAPATASGTPAKADAKVWENYDFVPGSKILFFTDFSEDKVGNFARGLKYVTGPMEVIERDGIKVLRSTARSTMLIPVGRILPQRFTLEFDIVSMNPGLNDQLVIEGGKSRGRDDKSAEIDWSPRGAFIIGGGQNAGTSSVSIPDAMKPQIIGNVAHIRILMDSGYFKMYTNERRMYNNPDLQFRRDSVIRVEVQGSEDQPVFVTSDPACRERD